MQNLICSNQRMEAHDHLEFRGAEGTKDCREGDLPAMSWRRCVSSWVDLRLWAGCAADEQLTVEAVAQRPCVLHLACSRRLLPWTPALQRDGGGQGLRFRWLWTYKQDKEGKKPNVRIVRAKNQGICIGLFPSRLSPEPIWDLLRRICGQRAQM